MELLWYDIRRLDEETMAQTMAMMDEARRRRRTCRRRPPNMR